MKLYAKNLTSIAALKKEKQLLQQQKATLDQEDLFSVSDLIPGLGGAANMFTGSGRKPSGKRRHQQDDAAYTTDAGSNILATLAESVLPLLMPMLGLIPGHTKKKFLYKILKEFGGGYLAWKSIQLGFQLVQGWMKNRKKHKKDPDQKDPS